MYKIQTLNPIAMIGLNHFPQELYEVGPEIQQPDAILLRSYDMHAIVIPSSVKIIGRAGAGVNNIPVNELTQCGIPVLNTPGANANAVRELVIAGMLLASRNIYEAWRYIATLKNDDSEINKKIEADKKQFVGFELLEKKLGVVGLGNVGVKVANAAISLGMKVIGYDPTITVHRAWELSSEAREAGSLEDLLKEADFISFHVPLTKETKHMMDASRIGLMKKGAVLLNFAREEIIDHSALIAALQQKKIHAYVSDFPTFDLNNIPGVITLPHLGASTFEAEENCAVMIVKHIRDFFEKGSISFSVNFPSIEMQKVNKNSTRLAIVNKNIPNMVAQISTKLAEANLNILSLLNKSRENIAYTLIDVERIVSESVLNEIKNIDGVVQVRQLKGD